MSKSVLVIESDDQGQFFLSVAGGTMTLGDSPSRPELQLRDLRVRRIRCEVEVEEDTVVVSRPAAPGSDQPPVGRQLHAGQGVRLGHGRLHLESREESEAEEAEEPAAAGPPAEPSSPAAPEGTFKRLRVIDGADIGRA